MALNSIDQSSRESSDGIASGNGAVGSTFKPFEETIICPGCNRPLPLYLQQVHMEQPLNCPRCSRNLTGLVRRTINERIQAQNESV